MRKDRAARLRAVGEEAVARHLSGQIGRDHRVLVETPCLGRTEQFTEVSFESDQPVGTIVPARITGTDGARLTA